MNHSIVIHGERLPILVRKHKTSRRFIIRYQPLMHALTLTLPRYASVRQGLRFVEEKRGWIERQISSYPAAIPLEEGQVIPVLGKNLTLCHTGGRGVVHIEGKQLLVTGGKAFMNRRVREFLKRTAKEEMTRIAQEKARKIGKKFKRISVRDTTSRWGSCSYDGCLSFSWRLIFAPYHILDYTVSHEVAHLKEYNHSDDFWALVDTLHPNWRAAEQWFKKHSMELYRYK